MNSAQTTGPTIQNVHDINFQDIEHGPANATRGNCCTSSRAANSIAAALLLTSAGALTFLSRITQNQTLGTSLAIGSIFLSVGAGSLIQAALTNERR